MSREREVLLLCARPGDAEERRAALDALGRADGERLLEAAVRHEVVPLLSRALGTTAIDAPTAARVTASCDEIARRNAAWTDELARIVAAVGRPGVLAFKGPTLAVQAYGDGALRAFDDLDLLVAREDLAAAADALAALGWLPDVDPIYLRDAARRGGPLPTEITFASFPGLPDVDVHLALFPRWLAMRPDEAGLRERAVTVVAGGRPLRTFAPDDLLLYLCGNGLKDGWTHLRAIADVAHLLESAAPADPAALAARSKQAGLDRALRLGVGLAAELLGAPVPAGLGPDEPARELVAEVASTWFDQSRESLRARLSLQLRARERWRDRARAVAGLPGDVMVRDLEAARLPRPLYPLYYVVRPLRLAWKYGIRRG